MTPQTFETIRYAVDHAIATITLHRPERLNAVNSAMIRELVAAFDQADGDDSVRVVVVTGAGRAFCAGADLGGGGRTFDNVATGRTENPEEHRDGGGLVTLRIFDLKKPVIAAINGDAVGFGATLTLPMDVRIASMSARIGFVFARRGVVPEAASTWFLPRIVGISRAVEWVTTGRIFDAEEAREAGLVRRVVEPDELLPSAYALAREIADYTSPVAVALARQMAWKLLGADHPMAAHRLDSLGMFHTGRSADAHEGVKSFLEKRPPRFTSRPSKDMPPHYPWW
ncbi:MAG: crotonase/enoyl-CoA hydratase family protein [Candidatus Rokubacteria bacterium]|nr:crotonase/enoyl-CoA hydratase family protein [Candidatus Rokubacteria bacterium]